MKKIKTIFDRNWEGDKTVIDKFVEGIMPEILSVATPTEKLDGMNVRVTIRNGTCVRIVFFSLGQAPIFENVPTNYAELKEWLPKQKSKYGNNCGIEGIVWHGKNGEMFKIKTKDFVKDNR